MPPVLHRTALYPVPACAIWLHYALPIGSAGPWAVLAWRRAGSTRLRPIMSGHAAAGPRHERHAPFGPLRCVQWRALAVEGVEVVGTFRQGVEDKPLDSARQHRHRQRLLDPDGRRIDAPGDVLELTREAVE